LNKKGGRKGNRSGQHSDGRIGVLARAKTKCETNPIVSIKGEGRGRAWRKKVLWKKNIGESGIAQRTHPTWRGKKKKKKNGS